MKRNPPVRDSRVEWIEHGDPESWIHGIVADMERMLAVELAIRGRARMLLSGGTTPAMICTCGQPSWQAYSSASSISRRASALLPGMAASPHSPALTSPGGVLNSTSCSWFSCRRCLISPAAYS